MKKLSIIAITLILCCCMLFAACGPDGASGGKTTYTFQAALTNLDDVEGEGFSGGSSGVGMISIDPGSWKTESGYYITYLYVEDTALTFEITADKDIDDAVITARIGAEAVMTISKDMYTFSVNGTALEYKDIKFTKAENVFKNYDLAKNIHLNKGLNTIKFITSNSIELGGTARATAPMVEALKITTTAKLTWEPKTSNLSQFGV